jgi:hypothetical protein
MATALDEALAYAEERNFDYVEVEPYHPDADRRSCILLIGDGKQMLVELGWGTAGLYANVRLYVEGEPITPVVMEMGDMVTVSAP